MRRIIFQILILFCGVKIQAQPEITPAPEKLDSLIQNVLGDDEEISKLLNPPSYYLYSGLTCDSKTFFAGRELGSDMLSLTGSIYLFHSGGLFLGATGAWYSDLDPRYSTTILTAGIRKYLDSKNRLSLSASYNRYFFNNVDTLSSIVYDNSIGAGLTLRNNWIGARLVFNAMFGKKLGTNLSPAVFANVTLARYGTSGRLFLAPEISSYIGTETVLSESTLNINDTASAVFVADDKYGLLNTQIYLPLGAYIGNFNLEIGYSLNLPLTQDNSARYPVSSFFSFSIGFLLPLN